jgi:hypothetical protein
MGGAVSSGESNDELVDNLMSGEYIKVSAMTPSHVCYVCTCTNVKCLIFIYSYRYLSIVYEQSNVWCTCKSEYYVLI